MTFQPGTLTGTDIRDEIVRLKKERNAIILGHYYQRPEIQDLADFVGDCSNSAARRKRPTPMSSHFAASSSWPKPRKSSARKNRHTARHGRGLLLEDAARPASSGPFAPHIPTISR